MSPSSAIASPLTLASLYSDHHGWLKNGLPISCNPLMTPTT
jgi:RNA polymerase sigma-70 factor (ECF subfamily)